MMFYEENVIKKLLNCNQCNQPFDLPLNLPCGKILCSNCVQKDTVRVDQFECKHCSLTHQIPTGGFPENESFLTLMREQPKEVCKSKEIEDLKTNLDEVNKELTKFEFLIRNPEDNIKNHFTEQKRLVQLKTEETILEINCLNEKLIQTLENNEKDCLDKLKQIDIETLKNYEKIIKPEIMKNKEKVTSLLNKGLLNETEVKLGKDLVSKTKESIETESLKINKLRFGDKFIEFKASEKKLSQLFLGDLCEKKEKAPQTMHYTEFYDDEAEEVENSDYDDENEDEYDEGGGTVEEEYDEEEDDYDEEEVGEDEIDEDEEDEEEGEDDFMDEDENDLYEEEQDENDEQYDEDEDEDDYFDEDDDEFGDDYYNEEEDIDYKTGDELNEDDEELYHNNENDDDDDDDDYDDFDEEDENENEQISSSNYDDDYEAERLNNEALPCIRDLCTFVLKILI